ncbi:MAG: ketol-acid reductoisomerase, partial [Gammaproteobacteria bacterium]|nr:ketol-acid reductoisomerase [Gammaproteobacteria bacterium]
DLMGEQTILCGMLQTGSLLCFDKMVENGVEPGYAAKLVQYGWETVGEALKHGGITNMMDRLSNPAKVKAFELAQEMKDIMRPLYLKHMDDIMTGDFSSGMMEDWANEDEKLLDWRKETGETVFENTENADQEISEQEYFDHGILMVAMVKAGVELAFETMTSAGIKEESAYYESLHETPLIANLIARKKLFEMNSIISDTAEYGCYLYNHVCQPLLSDFMGGVDTDVIGRGLGLNDYGVDNQRLIEVNAAIRFHPVEAVGQTLRGYMSAMKKVV